MIRNILLQSKHARHKRIFLIEKPVFNALLKIIGAQNQLHFTFCSDLVCNIILKARNSTPHTRISNFRYHYCTLNPNKSSYNLVLT